MSHLEYKLINVNNAINGMKNRIQCDLIDNLQSDFNLKKNLSIALNQLVAASESEPISNLLEMIRQTQADHVYQQFISFINILIINLHEKNELLGICKIINNVGEATASNCYSTTSDYSTETSSTKTKFGRIEGCRIERIMQEEWIGDEEMFVEE